MAAASPDGGYIITGDNHRVTRMWEVKNGKMIWEQGGLEGQVISMAFHPSGRTIAAGSSDNTIKIFDVDTGKVLRILRGHEGWVTGVAFSPNGRWLISAGSDDTTIRLWDFETGRLVLTFVGFYNGEWISYNKDGYFVASPDAGRHLLWRVDQTLYPFSDFSEKYNRPDLIAQSVSGGAELQ